MSETPIFSKETLKAIKDELPRGAIKEIAQETKFHRSLVYSILDGSATITEDNMVILKEAQRIIKRKRDREERLKASIEKTFSA